MSNALISYAPFVLPINSTEHSDEFALRAKPTSPAQLSMSDAWAEMNSLFGGTSNLACTAPRVMEKNSYWTVPTPEVGGDLLAYECPSSFVQSRYIGGELMHHMRHLNFQSITTPDAIKSWHGCYSVERGETFNRNNFFDLLDSVLVDVSRMDRFDVLPEANVVVLTKPDSLPGTASTANVVDERAVAVLESRQQRDAILLAKDFRNALEALVEEEQFSYYDLTRIIGVTRAMLSQWRERPLEKIRLVSHDRMGRLLFAWKYWLHVTEGDMLGRYLRHVPEGSTVSLMDILSDKNPSEEEITNLVDRLARYAIEDRKAGTQRRRDIGGLPHGNQRLDLGFD